MANPSDESTRGLLKDVGLRATHARILVYEVLLEVGGHHSVDDVVRMLGQRGNRIQRMSVYNVMNDLTTAGLVMCADTGPGRALYEVADTWHHHFVCRVCKCVVDIPCLEGKKPCLTPPWAPGRVDEAQIIFRGVCDKCAAEDVGM
jgi:Fur family ferric uptake transcriptional regulator